MDLKEYQRTALAQVRLYIESLDRWKEQHRKSVETLGPEMRVDFPFRAWEETIKTAYLPRKDGLGRSLPSFCLKIPTGGGKTLLGIEVIGAINSIYRKRQTGLVLWIVPSRQIYRQTLQALRDRDHSYRQHLDIASGGRTLILEKGDGFTPLDVAENLVIMMLMLPSAARQIKDTLRVFKDSGRFADFFPADEDAEGHTKLLKSFPNLDCFGTSKDFFGRQIKTSLGNTLRMLSPIIILDEGHRAYSEMAQETVRGFNPSVIVELSATPNEESNILVSIKGTELAREEMIKLDLHVINKADADWKNTMLASKERLDALKRKAAAFEANSGRYIRPICLIQVERTGKDQRGGRFIHAEDVREYLISACAIPPEQIAVKSSVRDDIEGIDLLSRDCPIRYIITKQALQEGWDCAFAYVLTILTNPRSKNNLTQLVGRILRQPQARKTRVKELDESYVFCYQQMAGTVLDAIKNGLEKDGLGDLQGRVIPSGDDGEPSLIERLAKYRPRFKKLRGRVRLPVFVIKGRTGWRRVSYESDILSRIDWSKADFRRVQVLKLEGGRLRDTDLTVGLSDKEHEVIKQNAVASLGVGALTLDLPFVARQLVEVVGNPWIAYEISDIVIRGLRKKNSEERIINNLVFIIQELRRRAEAERDRLSEAVFRELLSNKTLEFKDLADDPGFHLPSEVPIPAGSKILTRASGEQLELSLLDSVPEEDFNAPEKEVAWHLDGQGKLLWWFRNIMKRDYSIQGWRKDKIFPDFIVADAKPAKKSGIIVLETKGPHLKGNDDTNYKRGVFELCNDLAKSDGESKFCYELVAEGWRSRIDALLAKV